MELNIIDLTEGKKKVRPIQLFEINKHTYFVAEVKPGVWTLTEYSSGCRVMTFNEKPLLTKQEVEKIVTEKSLSNFQYCGKTLEESIAARIEQYGVCNE